MLRVMRWGSLKAHPFLMAHDVHQWKERRIFGGSFRLSDGAEETTGASWHAAVLKARLLCKRSSSPGGVRGDPKVLTIDTGSGPLRTLYFPGDLEKGILRMIWSLSLCPNVEGGWREPDGSFLYLLKICGLEESVLGSGDAVQLEMVRLTLSKCHLDSIITLLEVL